MTAIHIYKQRSWIMKIIDEYSPAIYVYLVIYKQMKHHCHCLHNTLQYQKLIKFNTEILILNVIC